MALTSAGKKVEVVHLEGYNQKVTNDKIAATHPDSGSVSAVPTCAPPDFAVRRPRLQIPAGACDCHAHVCGPAATYPLYAKRIYSPAETPVADYRRMLSALGVDRAVLVQPSFYGADNSAMLDALKHAAGRFRGVAVVSPDISRDRLRELHDQGVRGVRVNIVDTSEAKGVLPLDRLESLARRIRPFGWHIELLMHVDEFPDLDRAFESFPVSLVFGHLGYVRADKGTGTPGFQALLRMLRRRQAWVKLTGPYRISGSGLPYADTNSFAAALLDAAPGQVLWGSDWPHIMARWPAPMPNDADLVELLCQWIPDPEILRRVLVDNPASFYGFDE